MSRRLNVSARSISFTAGRDADWRNRLIWGDKKYVLPALLPEFQGRVDLIYIDPPFVTGADFTYEVEVGGESFTKEASAIEQMAYRDTWGRGLDSYLQSFYETTVVLRDFLADSGSIYVHLDWHAASQRCDEVMSHRPIRACCRENSGFHVLRPYRGCITR